MFEFMRRFAIANGGATAIEYALIAGVISIAILTAVGLIGTQLGTVFTSVAAGVGP